MYKRVSNKIQRPNNTTPYTAGDVIGTASSQVIKFDGMSTLFAQGRGVLIGATVIDNEAPATLASLELWLFTVAPADQADNAVFGVTDAELQNLAGIFPLVNSYAGKASDNAVFISDVRATSYELPGGSDALYGVLVVRNAYTPVGNETFTVSLSVSD
jgi:hypothetical protein